MAEAQDVDSLKRRGRRRLVGAVALVLVAVIVLPMVFDSEPRSSVPPVSVRIPGEDDSKFAPKLATPPAAPEAEKKPAEPEKVAAEPEKKAAEPPRAEAPAPKSEPKPEPKPEPKSELKSEPKPKPKPEPKSDAGKSEPRKPEPAAPAAKGGFAIQVGAFSNPQPVIDRLAEARLPHFTQSVPTAKGSVTRVRVGPFPTREAAEQALEKLKGLGFKPGGVTQEG